MWSSTYRKATPKPQMSAKFTLDWLAASGCIWLNLAPSGHPATSFPGSIQSSTATVYTKIQPSSSSRIHVQFKIKMSGRREMRQSTWLRDYQTNHWMTICCHPLYFVLWGLCKFWGDLVKRGRVRKNWTVEGGGGQQKYLNEPYPQEVLKLAFYKVIC
jgi:hypothetical protein